MQDTKEAKIQLDFITWYRLPKHNPSPCWSSTRVRSCTMYLLITMFATDEMKHSHIVSLCLLTILNSLIGSPNQRQCPDSHSLSINSPSLIKPIIAILRKTWSGFVRGIRFGRLIKFHLAPLNFGDFIKIVVHLCYSWRFGILDG